MVKEIRWNKNFLKVGKEHILTTCTGGSYTEEFLHLYLRKSEKPPDIDARH